MPSDGHRWVFSPKQNPTDSLSRASVTSRAGNPWVFDAPRPAAFVAILPFPHPTRPGYREHRLICLPDFQGVGIGNALSEFVASLFTSTGKPYFSTTSHPALIRHRAKSPNWRMRRGPSFTKPHKGFHHPWNSARNRLTAGFEYIGCTSNNDLIPPSTHQTRTESNTHEN